MGNPVVFHWGCHRRWDGKLSAGTNEPNLARTSYCVQGRDCVPGTSELIGEDLGTII